MAKSIKSITAYLVFEDFVNHKVPVRSISITSVAHNSMVASVEVHPNRHLMSMKRTIVVSLWCKYIDQTMCREEDYLIMKGSITSLQSSKSSNIKRYTLNLTDDRKFISDLPTKYLDLIQLQQEGYEEENYTIEDIFADLQYYNIKRYISKECRQPVYLWVQHNWTSGKNVYEAMGRRYVQGIYRQTI